MNIFSWFKKTHKNNPFIKGHEDPYTVKLSALEKQNMMLKLENGDLKEELRMFHAVKEINEYSNEFKKNWLVYPARRHNFGLEINCLEAVYIKRRADSFYYQWIDPSITHERELGDSNRNLPDLEAVNKFIEHNFRARCPIYPGYTGDNND